MSGDTMAYMDCKRDSLTERLVDRDDVKVVFLREKIGRGGSTTVDIPADLWPVFVFDSSKSPETEGLRFRDWCRSEGITPTVWCNQNEELMEFSSRMARAAELTTLNPITARQVRDKIAMKEIYLHLGIPHAEGRRIADISEISDAVTDYGLPIIVKPVDADSCRGAQRISEHSAIQSANLENFSDWMAEKYIVGREHQLCALVHRGSIQAYFVSRNPKNLLDILDGGINANITLSLLEQDSFDLSPMLSRIVDALGLYNSYFHAEFFLTQDGQVIMGEMAARMSGCEVVRNHGLARQAPIIDAIIDIYCDREVGSLTGSGDRSVGDLLLPARAGHIEAVTPTSTLLAMPGVERVQYFHELGETLQRHRNSGWCFGNVQISGADSDEVEQRMYDVLRKFDLVVS